LGGKKGNGSSVEKQKGSGQGGGKEFAEPRSKKRALMKALGKKNRVQSNLFLGEWGERRGRGKGAQP